MSQMLSSPSPTSESSSLPLPLSKFAGGSIGPRVGSVMHPITRRGASDGADSDPWYAVLITKGEPCGTTLSALGGRVSASAK
eukprot:7020969-Pyramimonas_sp.AAC.2